jgi:arylsulfatase A-like enzyme
MGKWHLSDDPLPYGFDLNVGGSHSGGPPKGYLPPHGDVPGLENVPDDEYLTDTLSQRAAEFVAANSDRPWALYLTHFAVHTPLQPKQQLLAKYEAKQPGRLHSDVTMATMIQAVDDGVGTILTALDASGQRDHTVIVFFSDNGGYGPATDMAPLKGYKGTYYEGGIREPLVIVWPGVVKPGSRCSVPVIGVDLFPTFCEIAGARLPDQPLDGVSLVPILTGDAAAASRLADRPLFWHFPAYLQSYGGRAITEQRDPLFRSRPCSVIRQGHWKLHEFFEDGGLELYDLEADIGEANNLAETHPEKTAELHTRLKTWRADLSAPVPTTPNPRFDRDAESKAINAALETTGNHSRPRSMPYQ